MAAMRAPAWKLEMSKHLQARRALMLQWVAAVQAMIVDVLVCCSRSYNLHRAVEADQRRRTVLVEWRGPPDSAEPMRPRRFNARLGGT
eukprot:12755054-Alexandrium_andersonii.AAC.1